MQIGIIIPAYRLNLRKVKDILRNVKTKHTVEKIVLFVHKFRKSELEKIRKLKIKKLKVFIEKKRKGKIGVIKKSIGFFKSSSIILVINGDIQIRRDSIENLLSPYIKYNNVGSTTGKGTIGEKYNRFVNYFNSFVCELHHKTSKKKTKLSQFYSFRHLPLKIPSDIVSDEAFFECMMKRFGLKNIYVENAIFYYSTPNSISKLFEQRRRNFIGNMQVKTRYHYNVSTIIPFNEVTFKTFLIFLFKNLVFMLFSLFFEILARIKGMIDYFILGERPYKWRVVTH